MGRAWKGFLKSGIILLFLSPFVYIFYHIDFLEFQKTPTPPFTNISVSSDPGSNQNSCAFRWLSPKEIHEENILLDSIAWPNTPSVPAPVSLEGTSNAARSKCVILPRPGGGSWLVGDQLEVMIKMFDFKGHPKNHGGDFFLTRLHNQALQAGVAGQVVDHLNGTYSAVFFLPWEGKSEVEQPQCNYTDLNTGELWFCYKPQNLSCDTRIKHFHKNQKPIKAKEDILFKIGVTMNVRIPATDLLMSLCF
ncbi:NXPE family member 3-like isoform X5 [Salarias fasciatus]|uniref:NXPE family member 3-like isoform X5 n=1 Tax=Salarias fasciatus TaxID=181472 RepID=UPI001176988E|nr:NXPE family member 3-like isoform X5 [Salarias fasciatus]